MKRLLVCLLLVGVVGCGESERTQKQPSGEGEQKAQQQSSESEPNEEQPNEETAQNQQQQTDGKPPSGETEQATKQPPTGTEQEAIAALGKFGGAFGEDEDGNVGEIDLSGTQITDAALVHLKELKKLESLRLTGTKITDAGLVHLKGLTKLRYLNLSDTQVTNAGVADLQKALSDCEILDAAGQRTEQPTKQPTELAIRSITNTIGMTLNEIPAGTFMMGSSVDETDREDGEHQHEVTISKAFYIQTTEVTQGQWKAVMDTEPWKGNIYVKEGANYAATWVSWDDAVAYCEKLSEREGKTYRLPTEAEWEYACRAGTKTTWSFGDDEKELGDYAWYRENAWDIGERYAHQVRLKKPNAFGLYDMHGNVFEWCHDYYGEDYYNQSPEQDPRGLASGSSRVVRGGSWNDGFTRSARSAYRRWNLADDRNYYFGFRLVRELD